MTDTPIETDLPLEEAGGLIDEILAGQDGTFDEEPVPIMPANNPPLTDEGLEADDQRDEGDEPWPEGLAPPISPDDPRNAVPDPLKDGLKPEAPSSPEQEQQKAYEVQEREHQATLRTQAAEELDAHTARLDAAYQTYFPDVQTPEDVAALAATDPARFAQLQAMAQEQLAISQQGDHIEAANYQSFLETEEAELRRVDPELVAATPQGAALRQNLRSYATNLGYSEEQLAYATAQDVVILKKAMAHDQAQTYREHARQSARKAPPVQRPGVSREGAQYDAQAKTMARLKRTGHIDDAAKVIAKMIS